MNLLPLEEVQVGSLFVKKNITFMDKSSFHTIPHEIPLKPGNWCVYTHSREEMHVEDDFMLSRMRNTIYYMTLIHNSVYDIDIKDITNLYDLGERSGVEKIIT